MRAVLMICLVVALSGCAGANVSAENSPLVETTTSAPTTTVTTTVPVATTAAPAPTTTVTTPTTAAPDPGSGVGFDQDVRLVVDGEARRYHLYVPDSVDSPAALVVDFHGLAGTAAEQDELSGMRAKADAEGFVVAQPEGRGALQYWETSAEGVAVTGDVAFARAVVADVAGRVDIDLDRVFATGMSNGGGMANRLACEAADVFAAVAPVAGAYTTDDLCTPSRPVPVLVIHGDSDLTVPIRGLGSLLPSITDFAAGWADRNGCAPGATSRSVAADVSLLEWSGCAADVVLYVVAGGGHGWPGTTKPLARAVTTTSISATDLMWDFFVANPMR